MGCDQSVVLNDRPLALMSPQLRSYAEKVSPLDSTFVNPNGEFRAIIPRVGTGPVDFKVTDEKGDPILHVQGNIESTYLGELTIQLVRAPQKGRPAKYTLSIRVKPQRLLSYIYRVHAPGQEGGTEQKDVTMTVDGSKVFVGDHPFMRPYGDVHSGGTLRLVLPKGMADSGSRQNEEYKYDGVIAETSTKIWDMAPSTLPRGSYQLRCGPGIDALLCILACICKEHFSAIDPG